jgi:hypothetical protein
MSSFDEIGEAMILAHEGQRLLAREIAAAIGRLAQRAAKVLAVAVAKVPPTEA